MAIALSTDQNKPLPLSYQTQIPLAKRYASWEVAHVVAMWGTAVGGWGRARDISGYPWPDERNVVLVLAGTSLVLCGFGLVRMTLQRRRGQRASRLLAISVGIAVIFILLSLWDIARWYF